MAPPRCFNLFKFPSKLRAAHFSKAVARKMEHFVEQLWVLFANTLQDFEIEPHCGANCLV